MPITQNWEPRGLHTDYAGDTSGEEILSSVLALSSDPRFDDLTYIIGDFSKSTGITAGSKDVETLAAYVKALSRTNPHISNPSILPNDDSGQALIALYVLITEDIPWKTTWVKTEAEARKWIADNPS